MFQVGSVMGVRCPPHLDGPGAPRRQGLTVPRTHPPPYPGASLAGTPSPRASWAPALWLGPRRFAVWREGGAGHPHHGLAVLAQRPRALHPAPCCPPARPASTEAAAWTMRARPPTPPACAPRASRATSARS